MCVSYGVLYAERLSVELGVGLSLAQRERIQRIDSLYEIFNVSYPPSLSDIDFGTKQGIRLTGGLDFRNWGRLEGVFEGRGEWKRRYDFMRFVPVILPGSFTPIIDPQSLLASDLIVQATLDSFEASIWKHVMSYIDDDAFLFSWLFGIRGVRFFDHVRLILSFPFPSLPYPSFVFKKEEEEDFLSITCLNDLLGFQAGGEIRGFFQKHICWGMQCKFGVYANSAQKETILYIFDFGNFYDYTHKRKFREIHIAGAFEWNSFLRFFWKPIFFQVSYRIFILLGPAVAAFQIKPQRNSNAIYYHDGLYFQLTALEVGINF